MEDGHGREDKSVYTIRFECVGLTNIKVNGEPAVFKEYNGWPTYARECDMGNSTLPWRDVFKMVQINVDHAGEYTITWDCHYAFHDDKPVDVSYMCYRYEDWSADKALWLCGMWISHSELLPYPYTNSIDDNKLTFVVESVKLGSSVVAPTAIVASRRASYEPYGPHASSMLTE